MKQIFLLKETAKTRKIFNETYEALMPLLKHRNPKANGLIDDPELDQLHNCLVLLRTKQLSTWEGEKGDDRFLVVEIKAGF